MAMRVTHTYAILEAPGFVYLFLRDKLEEAGYRHALIHDHGQDLVVLNGIAVAQAAPEQPSAADVAWGREVAARTEISDAVAERYARAHRERPGQDYFRLTMSEAEALFGAGRQRVKQAIRHYVDTAGGPVEVAPVTFVHEGGGPHRSCDSCLATVDSDRRLVHAAGCGAVRRPTDPPDLDAPLTVTELATLTRYTALAGAEAVELRPRAARQALEVMAGLLRQGLRDAKREPTGDPFDPLPSATMAAMTPAEIALGNASRALYLELPEAVAKGVSAMIGAVLREARAARFDLAIAPPFTLRQEFTPDGFNVAAVAQAFEAALPDRKIRSGLVSMIMTLGAALADQRVGKGTFWIYARDFEADGRRFSAWQFRVVGNQVEARFYNPDRETADGISIGWRPWRPALEFGLMQLRQVVTLIEPTEAAP